MPSLTFRAAPLALLGHARRLSARRHVFRRAPAPARRAAAARRCSSPTCSGSAAGFMGLHRFYLRSNWGFVFIPVFLADPLHHRRHPRRARGRVAHARRRRAAAAPNSTTRRLRPARRDAGDARSASPRREAAAASAKADFEAAQADLDALDGYSRWLAILMAAMLVGRRDPAARPGAQADAARGRRSAPTRRPRSSRRTCRRSARTRTRRSACTRASPTRSNGSTSASASTSPIGR